MRIRKYDFDYSRRHFLDKTTKGIGAAGVLTSMWPMLTKADTPDIDKAYPEELTSIEMQSKGKVKTGDLITAENVEHVTHLLDPITLLQVRKLGRQIRVCDTTRDISHLMEVPFLDATLRNYNAATLDSVGNIWEKSKGTTWQGGLPFTEPSAGLNAIYNITLAWGRHNALQYPIREFDVGPEGDVQYAYQWVWAEMNVTARTDGKVFHGMSDLLRFNTAYFTSPQSSSGVAFLNNWHYDQRKFPGLIGYLPAFKRVREYPANQRFEPLVPGATFWFSDAWAAGDPALTWGNYKIVERKPMLGPMSPGVNWHPDQEHWLPPTHGGQQGKTFRDTTFELVPEVIIVESEPTSYPRAPYSKKVNGLDARNFMSVFYNTYDRKGDLYKGHELGSGKYIKSDGTTLKSHGNIVWAWQYSLCYDAQVNRMTQLSHTDTIEGGYKPDFDPTDEDAFYNQWCTAQALRRLGA
ncbi:MAG: DUF1329 domain-containing protein [Sinobacteraceae bacterium]|nr:DUF1329 domain-containing protein [Nevskiaceae bacterium]